MADRIKKNLYDTLIILSFCIGTLLFCGLIGLFIVENYQKDVIAKLMDKNSADISTETLSNNTKQLEKLKIWYTSIELIVLTIMTLIYYGGFYLINYRQKKIKTLHNTV